jgi:hypothetical protein
MRTHVNTSRLLVTLIIPVVLGVSACGDDDENTGGGGAGGATTTQATTQTTTTTTTLTPPLPPLPVKWSKEETHSGRERGGFKGCHGMTTRASFYPHKDRVFASTDIWSHCELGGFTGTAWVELVDDARVPVGVAFSPDSWGVKGKKEAEWFGGLFERNGESWDAPVQWKTNADAYMVDHIEVRNHHAPRNRIVEIVNEGMAAGKQAVTIYQQVTAEFPSS